MANKHIADVNVGDELINIYGRNEGDIIQVPNQKVKVGGLVIGAVNTPSVYNTRCSIAYGGYYVLGNMCFVQVRVTTRNSFQPDGFYRLLNGLPQPAVKDIVPLSAVPQTTESSQICSAMVDANGYLALASSTGITADFNYNISGWYII